MKCLCNCFLGDTVFSVYVHLCVCMGLYKETRVRKWWEGSVPMASVWVYKSVTLKFVLDQLVGRCGLQENGEWVS